MKTFVKQISHIFMEPAKSLISSPIDKILKICYTSTIPQKRNKTTSKLQL